MLGTSDRRTKEVGVQGEAMRRLQPALGLDMGRHSTSGRQWGRRTLELALLMGVLVALGLFSSLAGTNLFVNEYHFYALAFWTGHPLFHALPVEYPILSILPFTLTLLPPLPAFQTVFAFWMGALTLIGYLGFLRFSNHRQTMAYAGYLFLGAGAVLLATFDLFPALVTLAALWSAQRGRFGWSYALLAAGILLKLYPIFLVPIIMIEQWRSATGAGDAAPQGARTASGLAKEMPSGRHWNLRASLRGLGAQLTRPATMRVAQGVGLCVAVVLLGYLGPILLNPAGTLSPFRYASDRPLEFESTPATLMQIGTLFGIPAHSSYGFGALNYVGPLDVVLKPLSVFALLGGCLWVYWRQARGKLNVGRAFLACVCVVIATNKVFSPQYLIWILPIVAAVEGIDLWWVAVAVLTTCESPLMYPLRHLISSSAYHGLSDLVLAVRNGLLLWVAVRAILGRRSLAPLAEAHNLRSQVKPAFGADS
jgi:hypothetical protein